MGHAHFEALTEDRREAAHAALRQVLGAVPVDAVTPLSGGITTASVFRIDAGARSYVLRVEGVPSPLPIRINTSRYGSPPKPASLRVSTTPTKPAALQ